MTPEFFESQMVRLKNQYGEKVYSQERMKLIFHAVKSMPDYWFTQVVTDFIGSSHRAPLLDAFIHRISDYQDQRRQDQSQRVIRGGDWLSALDSVAKKAPNKEFAKECLQLLRRRLAKEITREEFEICLELLGQVANKNNPDICEDCLNTGYTTRTDSTGYSYCYRCHCKYGGIRPETVFGARRQDGTREECPIMRISK